MNKKKFHITPLNVISLAVFVTFVLSAVFVSVRLIYAPESAWEGDPFERRKTDYVLMLLQCVLGIAAMIFPSVLRRRWRIVLPNTMLVLYAVFLFCAIYLGEVRSFYYRIPHWDTILHVFSGAMLGALGFSVVCLLNEDRSVHLKPLMIAMFAFCFAMTMGVVWEFYEYVADSLFGTNMQKFMSADGMDLLGREALRDTMKDLLVDALGALGMSGVGLISLRREPAWIRHFEFVREKPPGDGKTKKRTKKRS